ncbi:MAG: hypothetical protein ACTHKX_03500 [Pseudolysinimonas sp.]
MADGFVINAAAVLRFEHDELSQGAIDVEWGLALNDGPLTQVEVVRLDLSHDPRGGSLVKRTVIAQFDHAHVPGGSRLTVGIAVGGVVRTSAFDVVSGAPDDISAFDADD